jgi:hypothetical protein
MSLADYPVNDKPQAIIVDIDGTIADNAHRQHFLEGKKQDWDGFFGAMSHDKPIEMVLNTVKFLSMNHLVILVTGRPDTHKQMTVNWLKYVAKLPYTELFMRPVGPEIHPQLRYRPDEMLKRQIYHTAIRPIWDVRLVIDDRAKVVKMWREEGLPCWQVAEGDF